MNTDAVGWVTGRTVWLGWKPRFYTLANEDLLTDDPKSPVEDDLTDPTKQDPSPDLPEMLEGNEDSDDMEVEEDGST